MNILFIGNNPSMMSPTTDAMKAILNNCEHQNDNVSILFLGNNEKKYCSWAKHYSVKCNIDRFKVADFLKANGLLKTIPFLFKKICAKIVFLIAHYNFYEVKELYKASSKIITQNSIERIVLFETHTREKGILAKKIQKKIKKIKVLLYWLEMPVNKKENRLDRFYLKNISKNVYKNCIHERYLKYFKSLKIKNINLVEYPLTTIDLQTAKEKDNTILYIGKLYKDKRNPKYLFKLMEFFPSYELLIFGNNNIDDFKEDIKTTNIKFMDAKPLNELYGYISRTSCLVNLEFINTPRKTCKIASYIPSCRPILIIRKNNSIEPSINLKNFLPGHAVINEDGNLLDNIQKVKEMLSADIIQFEYKKAFEQMLPSYIYTKFKIS